METNANKHTNKLYAWHIWHIEAKPPLRGKKSISPILVYTKLWVYVHFSFHRSAMHWKKWSSHKWSELNETRWKIKMDNKQLGDECLSCMQGPVISACNANDRYIPTDGRVCVCVCALIFYVSYRSKRFADCIIDTYRAVKIKPTACLNYPHIIAFYFRFPLRLCRSFNSSRPASFHDTHALS